MMESAWPERLDWDGYQNFASAYTANLHALLSEGAPTPGVNDPLSVGSDFGKRPRPTLEKLGHVFRCMDTREILFLSSERALNIPYCIGSLLWTLSGSDDLEEIAFYNPKGRSFSDDSKHLSGAVGRRMLTAPNQLDAAIVRLREDRSTRRAFAVAASPHDVAKHSKDFPCLIGLQFLVRDEKVHCVTFMRSQSALMVLPYDVFLFMSLQRIVAAELDLPAGTYTHISTSFHLYEDEVPIAERVIKSPVIPVAMAPMHGRSSSLPMTFGFERELRAAVMRDDRPAVSRLASRVGSCSDFFGEARLILTVEAARRVGLRDLALSLADELPGSLGNSLRKYLKEMDV